MEGNGSFQQTVRLVAGEIKGSTKAIKLGCMGIDKAVLLACTIKLTYVAALVTLYLQMYQYQLYI